MWLNSWSALKSLSPSFLVKHSAFQASYFNHCSSVQMQNSLSRFFGSSTASTMTSFTLQVTPLITSWCSPRGEAVGSFLFSLLQNILQPDQANVPSQRGPWVSPCPCTAPSGGSDWTSHFALGTASASVRPATATARSVAQQAVNSSLDLGGSSLNPSQPGVFCSTGTTYNRLGLLELGVPRSELSSGYGTCRKPAQPSP